MGSDEHGPAYPEPEASRPWDDPCWAKKLGPEARAQMDATDGVGYRLTGIVWHVIIVAILLALLVFGYTNRAHAMNHGFNPDDPTVKWFESKMRPDSPPNSCCGKGDAYPVDRYECPAPTTARGCTVWIADGEAKKFPDGTYREAWDVSIPIEVPYNKINPDDDDLDNPTDMSWIFMRVQNHQVVGNVFCFVKHPSGN